MTTRRHKRPDFLEEMIRESTAENPRFPDLLAAAHEQRVLGERVAQYRRRLGLSQTDLAQRMGSTQRIISKIENGGDTNVSTLRRCLAALGLGLRAVAARAAKKAS
jgi:ribosome-binding protein aMBF1 (putative translation factor)